MPLNRFIIPKPFDSSICRRAKVDTGYECNYNCNFCYYRKNLNDAPKKTSDILTNIFNLSKIGITSFDLSGGESSIHPDFFLIVGYAKEFGDVSMLSNGSMLSDFNFAQRSKQCGLNEVLFSLHGWDELSHDKAVSTPGAFNNIIKAIENCKELNMIVRLNCTVKNDFNPVKYTTLINKLKPDQLNMLPLNYWEDSGILKPIDYTNISNKIKLVIDNLKGIDCKVRYIPFCFMIGYEKYVVGIYQHIYDLKDWNIQTYSCDTKQISDDAMFDIAHKNRAVYTKPMSCNQCSYKVICDGIEPQNLENNVLHIVEGETILNVNHFKGS